jgi:hypothetical protein
MNTPTRTALYYACLFTGNTELSGCFSRFLCSYCTFELTLSGYFNGLFAGLLIITGFVLPVWLLPSIRFGICCEQEYFLRSCMHSIE